MKSRLSLQWLAMVAVLTTTSGSGATQAEDQLSASIRKAGEIKVAAGAMPLLIDIAPDGSTSGYFVELMKLAFGGLKLPPIKLETTAWNAMIPALQAHRVDVVAPGLQMTADRCNAILYSAPMYAARLGLYVKLGNPKQIKSIKQITDDPELKVSTVTGGNPEKFLLAHGVPAERIVRVPDDQSGAETVLRGRADTYLGGQYTIVSPKDKGLQVQMDDAVPLLGYGITFRKEDAALRDAVSEQINTLRSNGTLEKMYLKIAKAVGATDKDAEANWALLSKVSKPGDIIPGCE